MAGRDQPRDHRPVSGLPESGTDALPNAIVVADRFHLVRLPNDMLTHARKRATRQVRGRRGRTRDPEWANRRKLLSGYERLRPDRFATMWNTMIDAGDPASRSSTPTRSRENLRQLLKLAGTNPDRSLISHRPWRFYTQAAASDSPEVHRLATTVDTRGVARIDHTAPPQTPRSTPATQ